MDDAGLMFLLPGQLRRQELPRPRLQAALARAGMHLLCPARQGEPLRPGARYFKPLRQIIESVNDALKGQLDLERHGGHTRHECLPGCCSASWP